MRLFPPLFFVWGVGKISSLVYSFPEWTFVYLCMWLSVSVFILRIHSEKYIDYTCISEGCDISARYPVSPTNRVQVSQAAKL